MVNHFRRSGFGRQDPRVLDLLGDPTRRKIVMLLAESPRHPADLAQALTVSRPAISRHLRLLRLGGLIEERRAADDRRSRLCRLRTAPLADAAQWLQTVQQFWAMQLAAFNRYVVEQAGMPSKRRGHGASHKHRGRRQA